MPRSSWTPADLRSTHQIALSVLASGPLKPSPPAEDDFRRQCSITGLYQDFRECGLPCGLHGSLCTLRLFRSVVSPPTQLQTLSMGGWLDPSTSLRTGSYPAGTFTLQETPSLLGALTTPSSAAARLKQRMIPIKTRSKRQTHLNRILDSAVGCSEWLGPILPVYQLLLLQRIALTQLSHPLDRETSPAFVGVYVLLVC
jgi:hypothetical protein